MKPVGWRLGETLSRARIRPIENIAVRMRGRARSIDRRVVADGLNGDDWTQAEEDAYAYCGSHDCPTCNHIARAS